MPDEGGSPRRAGFGEPTISLTQWPVGSPFHPRDVRDGERTVATYANYIPQLTPLSIAYRHERAYLHQLQAAYLSKLPAFGRIEDVLIG